MNKLTACKRSNDSTIPQRTAAAPSPNKALLQHALSNLANQLRRDAASDAETYVARSDTRQYGE
ncbi:ubiquitin-like protein UBact [Roseimaritima ulvae]|uniref:Uncharacterized protein n=1 Tax=Roseimaritima ulvae TaxID=980254 RepID=A0A5B9R6W1_9BACT|nr:ubiquitin-like protein UBact [Roseimaritima ulvae]QEG42093.1 hypothetical protein UC8_41240 [Roseimaritima ulvae]